MGLRFRKTFSIIPGVKLNIGKKSASVRVGVKGFGYTTGTAGKTISASLPGTGLSFSRKIKENPPMTPAAVPILDVRPRRRWFLLVIVYVVAGLIWWTILQPK
ncbi:DUF4236 domain-containing protein [Bradyrhizobium sp. 157]|uniref:DUF4236 domain-containing protein n=1 Tax=Bradyrhizobium sp. 157 TaxID=2782631 RepID=UPI001FF7D881|nr:DUF4236 domain-containing protein [Bradyrhizobium sp. 157]MCK1643081.1 DUF4236 domain-containing protein [Bradyrhizobium sp. 157]